LLTYVSIFLFFIKINFFFVGLIPLYYILKYRKFKILYSFGFVTIYFFIISYLIKNTLISGCLIYPIPITCFEFLDWGAIEVAEKWYFLNEVLNKSWYQYTGNLEQTDYINNFNWIGTWFNRTKIELTEFTITTFVALSITLISFKRSYKKNKISLIRKYDKFLPILISIFILTLLIFISKIPVIRMSHYLFVLISIIFIFIFFRKFQFSSKNKTLTLVITLCLIFNITKNFKRISENNFINDPYSMINSKIYSQSEKTLDSFKYYLGWYGKTPSGRENLENFKYSKFLIFHSIHK